ncbi:MAG: PEGA domain-containing protein [candidate division KSB1 bacterium]|nr:PEGA domain-containing protein [candidate division KSB1 bacterium]
MHRSTLFFGILLSASVLFAACSSGRLTTQKASQKLRPIAPLPEREQAQMPVNLHIQIDNVADAGSSYRNFVTLYINGKEIAPDAPEHNLQSSYEYSLRLQPGIYEVKAEYHVVGFWKEHVYAIVTDEPVKVLPNQRTELFIRLQKNASGFPTKKKNFFSLRYVPLSASAPQMTQAPAPAPQPEERSLTSKSPILTPKHHGHEHVHTSSHSDVPVMGAEAVILQINSVPVGADVFVDDRFVGQTPIRATVSRKEGHVIQITRRGFRDYLKVLEPEEFRGRDHLKIIVKLNRIER